MNEDREPIDLRRQVEETLRSLRSAGVEWLPVGARLTLLPSAVASAAPSAVADAPRPQRSVEERRQALELLRERVRTCTRCKELAATRRQTVFADGEIGAEIAFIGEAPGADEDAVGKPFVGKAGELLNKIIAACGMKREEIYICNIIKCRPPGNRTPLPEEAENCREYLEEQLDLVAPKYIVCFGATAATYLLGVKKPLGALRGQFHKYRNSEVVVTYHPAYLLPHRQPAKKKEVWDDMRMLLTKMGRPIPPVGASAS